jgi:MSHA pilin protein MshC
MNSGYSLIELVVTITVTAILAAIAIPYFSQTNVDASWFNERAKAAVRYAQRQAVAHRRSVYVNVTASTITLCYNPPPYNVTPCSPVLDLATGAAYSVTVPAGVTITAANFSFNGLGQPNPIAGTSFTAGTAITITGETGFVQ